ncbi:hypothetical protein NE237_007176 [Protea cynaroides]|uniref:Uncharacterized protein n=1 Tax=Protea cynaroides TaxID=273540 RepID=A0A9Q0KNQ5_9MAGN|nr:hypothetical protein NE237_007176 [Protea cynaroides]
MASIQKQEVEEEDKRGTADLKMSGGGGEEAFNGTNGEEDVDISEIPPSPHDSSDTSYRGPLQFRLPGRRRRWKKTRTRTEISTHSLSSLPLLANPPSPSAHKILVTKNTEKFSQTTHSLSSLPLLAIPPSLFVHEILVMKFHNLCTDDGFKRTVIIRKVRKSEGLQFSSMLETQSHCLILQT